MTDEHDVGEEHQYSVNAFKVYDRGAEMFKYSHDEDIRVTYSSKLVKRIWKYRVGKKVERTDEWRSFMSLWDILRNVI
ncbi:hypothetical protein H6P81_006348 [Aristolochia fimbriata]|uniref:Pre-mRNA-splicing factor Syf1/CRNKL1-like C-terminal HAT-repeats domain-containing protein n=1 Tax=Aristolochia fimbriata TaxID=158543 RepID=A0AAV7EYF4_ARIFI|nr:hypothetical protein H6P81_006348 [Aristolochia fimbriata]